ncbi:MAG: universal stress protein [Verrucomicrobiota bacterium]
MYQKILIPMENSVADQTILDHIKPLAKLAGASLLLMHVADGWVARHYQELNLADSEEMREDRAYLTKCTAELRKEGFTVNYFLALGEPADEIVKAAMDHNVDLIAMSTHGHRFIGDLLYGATADKVRHRVDVPVLLLKAKC